MIKGNDYIYINERRLQLTVIITGADDKTQLGICAAHPETKIDDVVFWFDDKKQELVRLGIVCSVDHSETHTMVFAVDPSIHTIPMHIGEHGCCKLGSADTISACLDYVERSTRLNISDDNRFFCIKGVIERWADSGKALLFAGNYIVAIFHGIMKPSKRLLFVSISAVLQAHEILHHLPVYEYSKRPRPHPPRSVWTTVPSNKQEWQSK